MNLIIEEKENKGKKVEGCIQSKEEEEKIENSRFNP